MIRALLLVLVLLAVVGWAVGRSDDPSLLAFPGAEGPAATVPGPRGVAGTAQKLTVDSLADDGTGDCSVEGSCTLRAALTTEAPRYIVFNVAGNVGLTSRLQLGSEHSDVYLSGATAPGLVTINNFPIELDGTRNFLLRYVQIRPVHSGTDEVQGTFGGPNCNAIVCRCADSDGEATTTTCTDETDDAACSGVGPEDAQWFIASETELSNCNGDGSACSTCQSCDNFALNVDRNGTKSAAETLAGNECAHTRLDQASITNGLVLRGDAVRGIVDHVSISWTADETINVNPGVDKVTIQNSISGNPINADPSRNVFGQRERKHHYGPLTNSETGAQVAFHRNVFLHHYRRIPRHTGGWIEWTSNLIYGAATAQFVGRMPGSGDIRNNLFRLGPDWAPSQGAWKPAYCEGGSDDGRACEVNSECTDGTCTDERDAFFLIGSDGSNTPFLAHITGNKFLDAAGTDVTDSLPNGGELSPQWDRVALSGERPLRSDDPLADTAYGERRTKPLFSGRRAPLSMPDPLTLDDSPDGLLYTAGANLPCRNSFDQQLIDSYENGTGYISPPDEGFVLPQPADPTVSWDDTDSDGLDDAWEQTHFGDLTTTAGLGDQDGDGYPDIEEWMNGTDPNSTTNTDSRTISACNEATASLGVSPSGTLSRTITEGGTASDHTRDVTNDGDAGSSLDWSASVLSADDCGGTTGTAWATQTGSGTDLSPGDAAQTSTEGYANEDGCGTGTHQATIRYTSVEADDSPIDRTLELVVESATASDVTASMVASQTTGPPPLGVVFDAGQGQSTHATIASNEVDHKLWYDYDFGSALSGTFPFGPQNQRNEAKGGPMRARVWESQWSGDVTVTATDAAGDSDTATTSLTVTNPNATGANGWGDAGETLCLSSSETPVAGSGGCPSVADVENYTEDFEAKVETEIAAGRRRILFKRGDSWSSDGTTTLDVAGPGLLGCYGTGARCKVTMSAADTPLLQFHGSGDDWRVADFELSGPGSGGGDTYAFDCASGGLTDILIHDVLLTSGTFQKVASFTAQCLDSGDGTLNNGLVISELDTQDTGGGSFSGAGPALFFAADLSAIVGSRIKDTNEEHVIRSQWFGRIVVENSELGPQVDGSKSVLTYRSPDTEGTNDCSFTSGFGNASEFAQSSDLLIEGHKDGLNDDGGCNSNATPSVEDSLWEAFYYEDATENDAASDPATADYVKAMRLGANRVTVRNFLFNEDGWEEGSSTTGHRAIELTGGTSWIYNGSCWYSLSEATNIRCVEGDPTVAQNIIHYAPNASPDALNGTAGTSGGLLESTSATNPFDGADPSAPSNFIPASGGVLEDAGVSPTLPRLFDHLQRSAPVSTTDIGGVERQAGD